MYSTISAFFTILVTAFGEKGAGGGGLRDIQLPETRS